MFFFFLNKATGKARAKLPLVNSLRDVGSILKTADAKWVRSLEPFCISGPFIGGVFVQHNLGSLGLEEAKIYVFSSPIAPGRESRCPKTTCSTNARPQEAVQHATVPDDPRSGANLQRFVSASADKRREEARKMWDQARRSRGLRRRTRRYEPGAGETKMAAKTGFAQPDLQARSS